jgi:hypothetical protein
MDTKKINDIEVKDYTDVTLQSLTAKYLDAIDDAKKLLRSEGYFVDNLWQTDDVTMNYDCTEEEAQRGIGWCINQRGYLPTNLGGYQLQSREYEFKT